MKKKPEDKETSPENIKNQNISEIAPAYYDN